MGLPFEFSTDVALILLIKRCGETQGKFSMMSSGCDRIYISSTPSNLERPTGRASTAVQKHSRTSKKKRERDKDVGEKGRI
jgi:hypothetical protein